jgi:hypothetical protein
MIEQVCTSAHVLQQVGVSLHLLHLLLLLLLHICLAMATAAGVYTGATTQLGHATHSHTFQIFGAIATCAHVVMWVVVICLTAVNAWSGRLFHAPCLSQSGATQQAAAAAAAGAAVGAPAGAAAEHKLELLRAASHVEEQLQQPATPGDAAHHAIGTAGNGSTPGAAACCATDDEEAVLRK